ncbi:uncharacterized protein LOC142334897 [Convolutriloba macropyga]|uniref:uncharacterized protein LOC142334897 n=1 Tax=Convolutriloba macropyga TaxID=536237 RepID=UPI003F51DE1F
MAMVKKVLTVFFRLALSMQAHEFTADSDTSLSRDKALPLQQITWMSDSQSADIFWPPDWMLRAIKFTNHRPLSVSELINTIYGFPQGQSIKCFRNYNPSTCSYHVSQGIAAQFMLHGRNDDFVVWDYSSKLFGQLQARGLQQLASTIHHFWKCLSGDVRSCPNPCDDIFQCSKIKHTIPGVCIQQEITKTQGSGLSTYNAAWIYKTLKCRCSSGYRWNQLNYKCELMSLCEDITPCHPNRTDACHDIEANKFWCECKDGFSGEFCDDENLCIIENLCRPNGKCVRTKSRSMGDLYSCDCRIGYGDDSGNDYPDCHIDINEEIQQMNSHWLHKFVPALVMTLCVATICPCAMLTSFKLYRWQRRHRLLPIEARDEKQETQLLLPNRNTGASKNRNNNRNGGGRQLRLSQHLPTPESGNPWESSRELLADKERSVLNDPSVEKDGKKNKVKNVEIHGMLQDVSSPEMIIADNEQLKSG